MTGIASNVVEHLDLEMAAYEVKKENEKVAKLIGINPASRTTCVKPAGTTSLVLGTSVVFMLITTSIIFVACELVRMKQSMVIFLKTTPN